MHKTTTALFVVALISFSPLCYGAGIPTKVDVPVSLTMTPELEAFFAREREKIIQETTASLTILIQETKAAFKDADIPIKLDVNEIKVSSEDIKNALTAGSLHTTIELKVAPDTMVNGSVGGVTLASFLTSAYQLNCKDKEISSNNVVIPAAVAGIGLLYLVVKNGYAKQEPKTTVTTSATPKTDQPAETKGLLTKPKKP